MSDLGDRGRTPPPQIVHPPLRLRPKRRVLFPDMVDLRLPRRRPKPPPPAEPIEPARLPTIAPVPLPATAAPPTLPQAAPPTASTTIQRPPPPPAPARPSAPQPHNAPAYPTVPQPQIAREPSPPVSVAVLDETATSLPLPRRAASATVVASHDTSERKPMYWRLLRLRYIRPNGWLRALFVEGSVGVAVVLVLAEKASVWTIIALPVVVALAVKANDWVAGGLSRRGEPRTRSQ